MNSPAAKASTSTQQLTHECLNPAAFGCKAHKKHAGRRRETIKEGADHPQFKHGERFQETIEQFRTEILVLQNIETLARAAVVITGPKTRGRKQAG